MCRPGDEMEVEEKPKKNGPAGNWATPHPHKPCGTAKRREQLARQWLRDGTAVPAIAVDKGETATTKTMEQTAAYEGKPNGKKGQLRKVRKKGSFEEWTGTPARRKKRR